MNGGSYRFSLCAAALGVLLGATPVRAEQEQANSQVGVIQPLSFIKTEDLDFGTVLAGTTAGTVTITPAGARTATGGVTLFGASGHQPAEFAGWGQFNQRVDVSVGSNSIWIYGPGNRMRVRTFIIGSTPTAQLTTNPRSFRISAANGAFRFPVGATLEVGANQAPGSYSGVWFITLNYQ